ncbi:MAG TPA: hypothetical protein PLV70_06395 [Flavobacteriales bacterium]|nr:hypothetical protein [Flavobacteriales bacterium]
MSSITVCTGEGMLKILFPNFTTPGPWGAGAKVSTWGTWSACPLPPQAAKASPMAITRAWLIVFSKVIWGNSKGP